MPATCEGCRYYATADATGGPCPACGRPLKFTLLPPPGVDPEPLPLATGDDPRPIRQYERDASGPGRSFVYEVVTSTEFLALAGVAGFVFMLGLLWWFIDATQVGALPKK